MKSFIVRRTSVSIALVTVPTLESGAEVDAARRKSMDVGTDWQHEVTTFEVVQEVKPS